jgi:hypothetical protein
MKESMNKELHMFGRFQMHVKDIKWVFSCSWSYIVFFLLCMCVWTKKGGFKGKHLLFLLLFLGNAQCLKK